MIETWFQWTCNGCGETEFFPLPCASKSDIDYCPRCVKSGAAKRRDKSMGESQARECDRKVIFR